MINLGKFFQNLDFNPIDKITLGYLITTLLYIICSLGRLEDVLLHIIFRFVAIAFVVWLAWLSTKITSKIWLFLRNAYPLVLLGFFYSETDYLNNILFNNLDSYFERMELRLFGVHPSIAFSNAFPQTWFSELMNLGYFSYYLLILLLPLWLWVKNRHEFHFVIFVTTLSFYLFYWFFILVPVAGPQFYLAESLRTIPDSGIFRTLVKIAEWIGEGPTAAFPSSHVGIVMIMSILAYRYAKEILWVYIIFGLLICFSTVYIKAHYAVDVIGGLVIAPVLLIISTWLYAKIKS